MLRRTAALVCALGPGCLVPNPVWSGSTSQASGDGSGSSEAQTNDGTDDTGPTSTTGGGTDTDGTPGSGQFCPAAEPLPAEVVIVPAGSTQTDIELALDAAGSGGTVALEPGSYQIIEPLRLVRLGVTLTSVSRDPTDTVLTGGDAASPLLLVRASGIRIEHLGLANSQGGIRFNPEKDAIVGVQIMNVQFNDVRNAISGGDTAPEGPFVDNVEVACSRFSISDELRETSDCPMHNGVAATRAYGWRIRDNAFDDYFCTSAGAQFAVVYFDNGSRGTIVERNQFRDVHRAVVFGGADPAKLPPEGRAYADNPCTPTYWGHIGGAVRNNLFWNGSPKFLATELGDDASISFWTTCDSAAYHNTIVTFVDPAQVFSAIEVRYAPTVAHIANNIMSTTLLARDGADLKSAESNIESAADGEFVDAGMGNLRLAPGSTAIDAGVAAGVPDDFEGQPRDDAPDIGADEFNG